MGLKCFSSFWNNLYSFCKPHQASVVSNETVNHLFLHCPFAKIIWRMIYFAFNISPPSNVTNMFGRWLNGVHRKDKARIRIGISAMCWAI